LQFKNANAKKPEQNLQPPEQSLGQRLDNGKLTRKDAIGKSDEEIMKEQAKKIIQDLTESMAKQETPTLKDAAKAAITRLHAVQRTGTYRKPRALNACAEAGGTEADGENVPALYESEG
jgi:hypothetical protein